MTADLRSAAGLVVRVRSDRCVVLDVRVRVRADAVRRSVHRAVLTATWNGDPLRTNRVRGAVSVAR